MTDSTSLMLLCFRFEKALKDFYQKWRETATNIISEELNSGAKDTVENLSSRLKMKLTLQLPWITWYPVVYNKNEYWDSNKEGYINMSGDFIKESGADKHVIAMFTRVCHDIKKSKPRRGPMVSSCTLVLFIRIN